MPYLPVRDLLNEFNRVRFINDTCAWYPSLFDVRIRNDYWQILSNANYTYSIFGAYLDSRPEVLKANKDNNVFGFVRILVMINLTSRKQEDYPTTFCQFWFAQQMKPVIQKVVEVRPLWLYEWSHEVGRNYPHIIACRIPKQYSKWQLRSVSIVSDPCNNATNNVRVFHAPLKHNEQKQDFIVCTKYLAYPERDISHRIIEFMETLRLLGASKVLMYNLTVVHPNVAKVLTYYVNSEFLEYRPFRFSLDVSHLQEILRLQLKRNYGFFVQQESILYNDCFYRNLNHFKYALVIDIDEIPMPLGTFSNWRDLMIKVNTSEGYQNCTHFSNYCFRCIYFPEFPGQIKASNEIPKYFYMLQHTQRITEYTPEFYSTKCFHDMSSVIGIHNHMATHFSNSKKCAAFSFPVSFAQLQHYREPDDKKQLLNVTIDKSLWRLKDPLIRRCMSVIEDLNLL